MDRGKLDYRLLSLIEEATRSLNSFSSETEQSVEQAILAIKQKGIP